MTQFIDVQNKKLLWDLLLNNGAFNGQSEQNLPTIQSYFEYTITEIEASITNKNLTEKNKEFLKVFIQKLNKLKTQVKDIIPPQISVVDDALITSQELKNKRRNDFDNNLESMRTDFNSMITVQKPAEIEFSDNDKDSPIKNMDDLLEKAAREREEILKTVTNPVTILNNESGSPLQPIVPKTVTFSDKITSSDTQLLREILKNQQIILEKLNKLDPKVL